MAEESPSRKRKCEEQVRWSDLDSLVLEKICTFLNRTDQANMSLVCKNWSTAFELPSVWKTFRFPLSNQMLGFLRGPVMNSVLKHSGSFRHVYIFSDEIAEDAIPTWCEHFIMFLQILIGTSKLDSVKFEGLKFAFECMEIPIYEYTCTVIAEFLGSQSNLQRLEFHECSFKYNDGIDLLKNICDNCSENLEILVLQGLIGDLNDETRDLTDEQLLPRIFRFPKLTTLKIDYWFIFGKRKAIFSDVIEKLRYCRNEMALKIWTATDELIDFEDFQLLPASDWSNLSQRCPNLQVELKVGVDSGSRRPLQTFIVENMPVTHLTYHFYQVYSDHSYPMDIFEFLQYLLHCKIGEHLVSFRLGWERPISFFGNAFFPLLNACKKLKFFELATKYPEEHPSSLLDSLLARRPKSLEKLKFSFYGDGSESFKRSALTLCSEYGPRLKSINLNLEVKLYSLNMEF